MRERRKSFRVEWHSEAKLYDRDGGSARRCIVSNFSNGGARIAGIEPSTIPDEFILQISPRCRTQKCHVIWRSKDGMGVKFAGDAKVGCQVASGRRRKALV